MSDFCMPSLGADMEAGTLSTWKIKVGDQVQRGDIIAEVETDKGLIEIEVFDEGVVSEILVHEGEKVPVGSVLAKIQSTSTISTSTFAPLPLAPLSLPSTVDSSSMASPEKKFMSPRIRISPLAKKIALDLNVDISQIQGTGPDGAIKRRDVERTARSLETKTTKTVILSQKTESESVQKMRRAIASAMERSKREIPHYYLETTIDMTKPLQWLEEENKKRSIKDRLLPVILLIQAVAKALKAVSDLNGYWIQNQHQKSEAVHLGFAISLRQGGLIAPAISHADQKSKDELMTHLRDLITRTRSGHLRSSELTNATATLTSLGDLGVEKLYGIIYPPQVSLIGFGKIMERPWAENGMIGIRKVVIATLSADHRASDGHKGAQFLETLNRYLQEIGTL